MKMLFTAYAIMLIVGFICGIINCFYKPNSSQNQAYQKQAYKSNNYVCENKYNTITEVIDEKGRIRKEENRSEISYPSSKLVLPPTSMTESFEELEEMKTSDYVDVSSSKDIGWMAEEYLLLEQLKESF